MEQQFKDDSIALRTEQVNSRSRYACQGRFKTLTGNCEFAEGLARCTTVCVCKLTNAYVHVPHVHIQSRRRSNETASVVTTTTPPPVVTSAADEVKALQSILARDRKDAELCMMDLHKELSLYKDQNKCLHGEMVSVCTARL